MLSVNWDLNVIVSSFLLISIAELADKTQIITFILSAKTDLMKVFVGSLFGFVSVNVLCILLAFYLNLFIPIFWTKIFSSVLFILFGFLSLRDDSSISNMCFSETSLLTIFVLVSSMEFADKTNVAVLGLIFNGGDLFSVFLGLLLSGVFMMGIACILGCRVKDLFKFSKFQRLSSIIFILLGVILLFEAFSSSA